MTKKTVKTRVISLTAVVLLSILVCAGIASAVSEDFTAEKFLPPGSDISPGVPVSISIRNLTDGVPLNLQISASHLVNTTFSGFEINNFNIPFGMQNGHLIATATNVDSLELLVDDGMEKTFTAHGEPFTIDQTKSIRKQMFPRIKLSGKPKTHPPDVGTSFWVNGTVTSPDIPNSWLNFTFQGATQGTVTISVYQNNAQKASWQFTISTPLDLKGSETHQTPGMGAGDKTHLGFEDQTDCSIDFTANGAVPAGTSVTVKEYTAPPTGSSAPAATFKVLGKYIEIEAPDLAGKTSEVNITMKYKDSDVPAGTDESSLRIYYWNPATSVWEALPGGCDSVNNMIWGKTTHFSIYAAFGSASVAPAPGPISGGSSGGGGGGGGSSGGFVSRAAGALNTAQLGPVASSETTMVTGTGKVECSPLMADLVNMPGVMAKWSAQINDKPSSGAQITTAIQQTPDQSTFDGYRFALQKVGQDVASIAYVMVAQKTGIKATGPAIITMTVPQDWVTQNGGTEAVKIVRMADDGSSEVLETTFSGYDKGSGYLVFTGTSPNGLSTFGLVAVKSYTPTPTMTQTAPVKTQQAPAETGKTAGLPWMTIVIGLVIVLIAVGTGAAYYSRSKKQNKPKNK